MKTAPKIDIGSVAYVLENIERLKSLSKAQLITLGFSSFGAALTAGVFVSPIVWKLVLAAFGGALITNVVHLLQTPPEVAPKYGFDVAEQARQASDAKVQIEQVEQADESLSDLGKHTDIK